MRTTIETLREIQYAGLNGLNEFPIVALFPAKL